MIGSFGRDGGGFFPLLNLVDKILHKKSKKSRKGRRELSFCKRSGNKLDIISINEFCLSLVLKT